MDTHELNHISFLVLQSAIEVHRALGPGLLENIYRPCLIYELRARGRTVVAEQFIPISYKGMLFDGAYRLDILVDDAVVVELKCVEAVVPVHRAQLRSYLKLANKPLGLLINFNVPILVQGVTRVMNGVPEAALHSKLPKNSVAP